MVLHSLPLYNRWPRTTDYSDVNNTKVARQIQSRAFWNDAHPFSDLLKSKLTFSFGPITVAPVHLDYTPYR